MDIRNLDFEEFVDPFGSGDGEEHGETTGECAQWGCFEGPALFHVI